MQGGVGFFKFKQGFEDTILAVPQHNQLFWPPTGDLTAQFAAYRAAGTGDQHNFARKYRADLLIANAGGLAAQQVRNIHFAQPADAHFTAEQLVNTGHGAERDAFQPRDIGDGPHNPARRAGDGNDYFVDP